MLVQTQDNVGNLEQIQMFQFINMSIFTIMDSILNNNMIR